MSPVVLLALAAGWVLLARWRRALRPRPVHGRRRAAPEATEDDAPGPAERPGRGRWVIGRRDGRAGHRPGRPGCRRHRPGRAGGLPVAAREAPPAGCRGGGGRPGARGDRPAGPGARGRVERHRVDGGRRPVGAGTGRGRAGGAHLSRLPTADRRPTPSRPPETVVGRRPPGCSRHWSPPTGTARRSVRHSTDSATRPASTVAERPRSGPARSRCSCSSPWWSACCRPSACSPSCPCSSTRSAPSRDEVPRPNVRRPAANARRTRPPIPSTKGGPPCCGSSSH